MRAVLSLSRTLAMSCPHTQSCAKYSEVHGYGWHTSRCANADVATAADVDSGFGSIGQREGCRSREWPPLVSRVLWHTHTRALTANTRTYTMRTTRVRKPLRGRALSRRRQDTVRQIPIRLEIDEIEIFTIHRSMHDNVSVLHADDVVQRVKWAAEQADRHSCLVEMCVDDLSDMNTHRQNIFFFRFGSTCVFIWVAARHAIHLLWDVLIMDAFPGVVCYLYMNAYMYVYESNRQASRQIQTEYRPCNATCTEHMYANSMRQAKHGKLLLFFLSLLLCIRD